MKEKALQRCLNEMEAALVTYIEKYGATRQAKKAISRLTIARAVWGDNLDK